MITWSEPGWLDERMPDRRRGDTPPASGESAAEESPYAADLKISADWIERLESDGLPEAGADPLSSAMASSTRLPHLPPQPVDRFEVIWPTGDVDEQFGSEETASIADHHPDLDRAGPTARVARVLPRSDADARVEPEPDAEAADDEHGDEHADEHGDELATSDVVLAVRRAVASIETGSLVARRRLAGTAPEVDSSRGVDPVPPGRVAVRSESSEWAPSGLQGLIRPPIRSVFDETANTLERRLGEPAAEVEPTAHAEPPSTEELVAEESSSRTGALRRLIHSLRR
jgi:hypothetical protein